MTIKEAILKSLEDMKRSSNFFEVYEHIVEKKYYEFKRGKTPASTVSAILGDFIRNGDTRVKRIKESDGTYSYYLAKNKSVIENQIFESPKEITEIQVIKEKKENFEERDLHKLLSSFLKSNLTYSKTIFHEQSNRSDEYQKWIHPDLVGINFLKLQTNISQSFLKVINRVDTFKISSYEVKKEINTDYELKKCYFQAVSNSSWANFGYLVAFGINDNLVEEMERLNQSFGIGIIKLKSNPYESKVLFQAKYKELDFKTIDKLCKINLDFEKFIEQIEKLMTASEKYISGAEKELDEFCDDYFENDTEVEEYCKHKNIPNE